MPEGLRTARAAKGWSQGRLIYEIELYAQRHAIGGATAATLAAWQALDVGAADRAWRHYELAKQAAREAERPRYLAHAMGEQAYVLSDAGQPELALQLVQEALAVRGDTPPRLTAWLLSA